MTTLLTTAVVGLVAAVITNRDAIGKRTTRPEVIEIVQTYETFGRERGALETRLQRAESQEQVLVTIIRNNTEAIQELRLQLQRFGAVSPDKVLESLEAFRRVVQKAIDDKG